MAVLDVHGMSLRFGGLTAVDNLSFSVQEKQIFSIIGPNGAGKTTVFNGLTAIYEPEGEILFEGRPIRRPLTWRVVAWCAFVGLASAVFLTLVSSNLEALWATAIKSNFLDVTKPLHAGEAWNDLWKHLRGDVNLKVVKKASRWHVMSPDLSMSLRNWAKEEEARLALPNISEAVRIAATAKPQQRGNKWVVLSEDGTRELASFRSADDAQKLKDWAELYDTLKSRGRRVPIMFLVGFLLGGGGAFAIWSRNRRTADLVARAGIARTFQNIRLFQEMTVLENVQVALENRRTSARAVDGLAFVGLEHRKGMLAKNLPYGEQRRLEIARALATEPKLLLLDEPAAGMNPSESRELMKLIQRIRDRGVTVLLIEHHMKVVMGISDRIAVLDHGVKIAEGSPQEIQNDPKVLEAYLGREEVE